MYIYMNNISTIIKHVVSKVTTTTLIFCFQTFENWMAIDDNHRYIFPETKLNDKTSDVELHHHIGVIDVCHL